MILSSCFFCLVSEEKLGNLIRKSPQWLVQNYLYCMSAFTFYFLLESVTFLTEWCIADLLITISN